MHILYYSWQENTTSDFLFSMQALGHQVSPCMHELSYYFSDGVQVRHPGPAAGADL